MTIMKNAWLITWEGHIGKRVIFEITAILSAKKSDKKIAEFVELLYLRATSNASDMAFCANRRKEMPRLNEVDGHIIMGINDSCWLHDLVPVFVDNELSY